MAPFTGVIKLDQGVAEVDHNFTLELAYRSIDFVGLSIIYPILSTEEKSILLRRGQSSVSYFYAPRGGFALRYSITLRCTTCTDAEYPIFYTTAGSTSNELADYILERDELPSRANFTIRTQSTITGLISLVDNKVVKEDTFFSVSALDAESRNFLQGRGGFLMKAGTGSVPYELIRLPRSAAPNGYRLRASFDNPRGKQITFDRPGIVDSSSNQTDINFSISLPRPPVIVPILDLLNN